MRSYCGEGTCPSRGRELRCSDSICRRLAVSLEDLSAGYRSTNRLPRPARVISGVVSAARRPPHSAQHLTRTAAPYKRRDEGRRLGRSWPRHRLGTQWAPPSESHLAPSRRKASYWRGFSMKPTPGLEPGTPSLRVKCST